MKKRRFSGVKAPIWLSLLFAVAVLCAVRIHGVNNAPWLEKYAANIVRYAEGEEVALPSEYYYFSGYEALDGYYMQVVKTELVPTETLLKEYDMPLSDLEGMSESGDNADLSDYEYTYIVTAKFGNRDFPSNADYHIELDDFLLTGPDYIITVASDTVNAIPAFNEELKGSTSFGISSGREMTFRLAYLIDTRSESALSINELLSSTPKLLIGYYPDEIFIELPAPANTG